MNAIAAEPLSAAETSPERAVWLTAARDLRLGLRSRAELIQALVFLVVVVSLFPLAIGPETALLSELPPVWFGSPRCCRCC